MAIASAAVPLLSGAGHIPAAFHGLIAAGWTVAARPPGPAEQARASPGLRSVDGGQAPSGPRRELSLDDVQP